jgi:RNA polymerase sigma-70 factor (ECF subfamily)
MQDKTTFVAIIKEHEGIIYKITRVYTDTIEDQKDLYQEIVYQLWKSFDSFKGNSKISTWIYRIALNTSIAHLNKRKKKIKQVTLDFELLKIADQKDTVIEERLSLLYQKIKQLNVVEKGLILLFLEGKSYDEIAAITGFTSSNVGTRLSRIKKKLKDNINK